MLQRGIGDKRPRSYIGLKNPTCYTGTRGWKSSASQPLCEPLTHTQLGNHHSLQSHPASWQDEHAEFPRMQHTCCKFLLGDGVSLPTHDPRPCPGDPGSCCSSTSPTNSTESTEVGVPRCCKSAPYFQQHIYVRRSNGLVMDQSRLDGQ